MAWRFPLIGSVTCFALGIYLAGVFQWTDIGHTSIWLSAALSVAVGLYRLSGSKRRWSSCHFASTLLLFTALGAWTYVLHLPKNEVRNYAKRVEPGKQFAKIALHHRLPPTANYERWVAEVAALASEKTRGKLLVYLPKSEGHPPLYPGELFMIHTRFLKPPAQRNPYPFEYATYLFNQNITHQVFLSAGAFQGGPHSLGLLDAVRRKLERSINSSDLSTEAQALLKALLLGTRAALHRDTLRAFTDAGVVHVLAVSGLHIGILALLLRWLFSFLLPWKWGASLRAVLIVLALFLFAAIVGFKASVTRASLMFSLFALTDIRRRPTNPFNILALAALLTLITWPKMLFQLGFQLSYAVVGCILWFYPHWIRIYRPKNRLLAYFYRISVLSFVAQLGASPFTLFYFHQFPTLFWLGNLTVIPLVTPLLGLGMGWLSLTALGVTPPLLTGLINRWASALLGLVKGISHLPYAHIEAVYFDFFMALSLWASLFFLGLFIEYKKGGYLLVTLLLSVGIQLHFIGKKRRLMERSEFVVFDAYKRNLALYKVGDRAFAFYHIADSAQSQSLLKSYLVDEMVSRVKHISLDSDYADAWVKKFQNHIYTRYFSLQIISGDEIYRKKWQANFIWLQDLPRVNRISPCNRSQPHFLILDGSSHRKNAMRFTALAAADPGLRLWDTQTSGAFQLSLN